MFRNPMSLIAAFISGAADRLASPPTQFRYPTPPKRRAKKFGYANGVQAAAAKKRAAVLARGHLDTDGAVTLVGRNPRRTWLGGISAQRGY